MATINYKAETLVRDSMHRPYIKDGEKSLVLYTKVAGYGGADGEDIESKYAESNMYKAYLDNKDKTYNSPRNIRRLFVTENRVVVQYYTSPVSNGKREAGVWSSKGYLGTSIHGALKKAMEYERAASISREATKKMDKVTISGNFLKAIVHPVMCSNIEEIYFDEVMFKLAMDVDGTDIALEASIGIPANQIKNICNGFISGKITQKDVPKECHKIPYMLLSMACGEKSTNLKRLRTVAMIKDLDNIINGNTGVSINRCGDINKDSWIDINKQVILRNSRGVLIHKCSIESYSRFSVSESIYLFDSEVLGKFFENVRERILKEEVDIVKEMLEDLEEKTAVEEEMDRLLNGMGEQRFKRALQAVINITPKNDVDEIFRKMTNAGATKYKEILKS